MAISVPEDEQRPGDDPDRLEALRRTMLLDSAPERAFDRVTALVRRLLAADVALVSLVDAHRQFFKSAVGLPEPWASRRETPLSHSFCQHVVADATALRVDDARVDDRVKKNPAVRDLKVIGYLGVPIRTPSGHAIGSLCAITGTPRQWSEDDVSLLGDLAAIVETEIALRDQVEQATELADTLELLAREYDHRVKNAFSVATALIRLSAGEADSIDDLVAAATMRIDSLARAHDAAADLQTVDLAAIADTILDPYREGATGVSARGPAVPLNFDQLTPVAMILHELATNSAKYGAVAGGGEIAVTWALEDDGIELTWNESLDTTGAAQDSDGSAGRGSRLLQAATQRLGGQLASELTGDHLQMRLSFPHAAP